MREAQPHYKQFIVLFISWFTVVGFFLILDFLTFLILFFLMHVISEDSISKSFLQEVLSVLAFLNPCISDIVIYSALTD